MPADRPLDHAANAAFHPRVVNRRQPRRAVSAIRKLTGDETLVRLRDGSGAGSDSRSGSAGPRTDRERHEALGEIARGGMGVVLAARDPALGREVALEVIAEDLIGRRDIVDRFLEEEQICGQLSPRSLSQVSERFSRRASVVRVRA